MQYKFVVSNFSWETLNKTLNICVVAFMNAASFFSFCCNLLEKSLASTNMIRSTIKKYKEHKNKVTNPTKTLIMTW